jgi:hypothetical protein
MTCRTSFSSRSNQAEQAFHSDVASLQKENMLVYEKVQNLKSWLKFNFCYVTKHLRVDQDILPIPPPLSPPLPTLEEKEYLLVQFNLSKHVVGKE